ncbi:MAG: hypothetical protein IJZ19_01570, partial [Lentisphaeria bacterium]|nr:hypothetical protein [Lentisphaeria bacterium]
FHFAGGFFRLFRLSGRTSASVVVGCRPVRGSRASGTLSKNPRVARTPPQVVPGRDPALTRRSFCGDGSLAAP